MYYASTLRKLFIDRYCTSEYGGVVDLICGRSYISSKKLLSNGSIESSPYTLFNADSSGGEAWDCTTCGSDEVKELVMDVGSMLQSEYQFLLPVIRNDFVCL